MNVPFRLVVGLVLALGAAVGASAEWRVWTSSQTERFLREAPAGVGREVTLSAARNEWESFQILVRSTEPVAGVVVEAGDLRGEKGSVLRAEDARLYRQHQFHLTAPTYRNEAFTPGWYPDGLIPSRHPLTGEPLPAARLVAVPFDLPAGQTHGFLVDVYVPSEANPGEYHGAYRVKAPGQPDVEIPVTLFVWDFALPAVPTLQTAFGSPADRMRDYYAQRVKEGKEQPPADWSQVDAQCVELLSRYRINATPPPGSLVMAEQPDGTFEMPAERLDALRAFVDRYHVNALEMPHPNQVISDPVAERDKLRAWLAGWDRAIKKLDRPRVTFFIYLIDEPNDEKAYRYVQKWGREIREAHSAVKVMVTEQTWPSEPEKWGDLYGAVDIWCPLFPLFRAESAAKRQALGETIWAYTALCQLEPTPWWHTDYPLLNYRVPTWIAWRYRIRGLLYWGGLSFWEHVDDPWTQPGTYDVRKKEGDERLLFNGEGSLVYPARAVGHEGIAPSLRLVALRDSIEDYEYLALLERAGRAAEAERVVLRLAGSWNTWEKDPNAYNSARAKLAKLLLAKDKAK